MDNDGRKRSMSGPAGTPSKRKKYACLYNKDWEPEFTWATPSDRSKNDAFCTLCQSHFGIGFGGRNDITKHAKTQMHVKRCKTQAESKSMGSFFPKYRKNLDDKVMKAETVFCNFVTEHNLAFSVADHFTKLIKVMFTDSETAVGFSCGKTKTTQIVKKAIATDLDTNIIEKCRSQPFSIMCDESNDKGNDKCFAILVRLHDKELKKSVTRFLNMPVVNIGTGANLFDALNQTLADRDIPWGNVIGFVSDNCSVMKGKKNSVLSRIREVQPNIMDIGCICHLANLCAGAAVKALPLPVDDLIIDIYYHFHHSSKRKEEYQEFLEFLDVEPLKILKHVTTRWLSLQKCVGRTLHHWPALRSYFTSHKEVEKEGRVKRVAALLNNQEMLLYFQFLSFILIPMNEFNTAFQADAAKIGLLHGQISRLLRKFLGKFVKASVISSKEDLTCVDHHNPDHQLPDHLLAIGPHARTHLADNEDDIGPEVEAKVFSTTQVSLC